MEHLKRRVRIAGKSFEYAVFLVFVALSFLPLLWGLLTSLKPPNEIFTYPPRIFHFAVTLSNYARILETGFITALFVSVFNSAMSILIGTTIATIAAYGFDRYRFRFRKIAFFFVVIGIPLAIGSSALLIPNYLYMTRLHLTNNRLTLVLLYTAYNLPMAIWIMKGIFESIPVEIDESARLEGCGDLYILFRMLLPLTKPALAASALFIFIGAWNEFIAASVMVSSPQFRPVQLAIYNYMGYFGLEWGPLTASATVAIVPVIFVFTRLGKLLISGLTQGSTKM